MESLIFSGAFDSIDPNRNKLFVNLERSTSYAQKYNSSEEANGQEGLFVDGTNSKVVDESLIVRHYEEFHETEKYNKEKAAIFYYRHPL